MLSPTQPQRKHLGESRGSPGMFFLAWRAQSSFRITHLCVQDPKCPAGSEASQAHRRDNQGQSGGVPRRRDVVAIATSAMVPSKEARPNPRPISCSQRPYIIAMKGRFISSLTATSSLRSDKIQVLFFSPSLPPSFSWLKWSQNILYPQMCTFRKIIHPWKEHKPIKTYS